MRWKVCYVSRAESVLKHVQKLTTRSADSSWRLIGWQIRLAFIAYQVATPWKFIIMNTSNSRKCVKIMSSIYPRKCKAVDSNLIDVVHNYDISEMEWFPSFHQLWAQPLGEINVEQNKREQQLRIPHQWPFQVPWIWTVIIKNTYIIVNYI